MSENSRMIHVNSLIPRPYVSFNFEGVRLRLANRRMVHTCREDVWRVRV